MAGIYIHIPFCKKACTYCDFHFSTSLATKYQLVKAMCLELEQKKEQLIHQSIDTIYFGGGTPSLLSEQELESIFNTLHKHYNVSKAAEITLECNPDDLTAQHLKSIKQLGVNRLSIGLQSFIEEELVWMNRAHTAQQSKESVRLAQDVGFTNLTIDLIYGSKFQTLDNWLDTLRVVNELNVPHISAYNLTVEHKTALGYAVKQKKEPIIDDEKSELLFLTMVKELERQGYIHYEISNLGKEGFFSRHNSNYWKGVHYLGIGPSAHSYNGNQRTWNVANNRQYIQKLMQGEPYYEQETLSSKDKYNEYVLTSLRTVWGCDSNYIHTHFGSEFLNHFITHIQPYILQGYVVSTKNIFTLSLSGKLLADKISSDLFIV